jgi:hypothetical protein
MDNLELLLAATPTILLMIAVYYGLPWLLRKPILYKIRKGKGVFLTWNYSKDDWSKVITEFPELKSSTEREMTEGKVLFTKEYIYLTNYKKEILLDIAHNETIYDGEKQLTEVRHLNIPPTNFIAFHIRTELIDKHGRDKSKKDYFTIPVPTQHQFEIDKVVSVYQEIIDKNAGADYGKPPSLFGR